jgi:cell fate (sporulation/competence/biofilm development) regulator YlbF (YheA/YmcA/DUF963 family)
MATKKQKREAAQAKREQFLKEERERGLEAQRLSQEADEMERQRVRALGKEINDRYKIVLRQSRTALGD